MGTDDFIFVAPNVPWPWSINAKNIPIKWPAVTYDATCNLAHRLRVCRATRHFMKKNSLLSLIILAVFASSASAAHSQLQAEPVVLPTYTVSVPRLALAEQRVQASLNTLRAKADMPAVITFELPALKTHVASVSGGQPAVRLARS